MQFQIPTLETDRLTLCAHRAEDLDDELALWSDPEVVRHISGKPSSREEVWARLLRYVGHWAVNGYGFWQIRERATNRFVGDTGLADFKRGLALPLDGVPEAGWVLAPWSHGKGYATEAMTAVLAWADEARCPHTVCIINPGNTSSIRVAAKLGYREVGRTPYHGVDVIAFERRAGGPTSA
jgi:RimJ/RimL family protein N-acetyltransferase